eukprot:CAMPEP_0119380424 /NCGR_PEP_ID=MMETSP1334-20130426/56951_1 /TAXON_ID=127549 /ORGANISM="Calcidiscus leptoporus, Strain RCC1130" /LENGTH=184 /DNA_ID=CAMNT_0007400249 /DNA_START=9 /DNA_END=563 /DNA_ORIENTATION=+
MALRLIVLAAVVGPCAAGFRSVAVARHTAVAVSRTPCAVCAVDRRGAALGVVGGMLLASGAGPSWADTQAIMEGTMKGFDDDEARRAAFLKKQKAYKKAWRKELANFEYATSDDEAMVAINALTKMVKENGMEIPEGVRKMDLDQVYKRVKPNLGKNVRLAFGEFDRVVGSVVTVKDLRADDGL